MDFKFLIDLTTKEKNGQTNSQLTFTQQRLTMGNHSKRGKCGPAPTQKSQWGARFGGQDPHPQIGSPVGNQALIVPGPL